MNVIIEFDESDLTKPEVKGFIAQLLSLDDVAEPPEEPDDEHEPEPDDTAPPPPPPPPLPAPMPNRIIASGADFRTFCLGLQPIGALIDIRKMPYIIRSQLNIGETSPLLKRTSGSFPFATTSLSAVADYIPGFPRPAIGQTWGDQEILGAVQAAGLMDEVDAWLAVRAAQPKFS